MTEGESIRSGGRLFFFGATVSDEDGDRGDGVGEVALPGWVIHLDLGPLPRTGGGGGGPLVFAIIA